MRTAVIPELGEFVGPAALAWVASLSPLPPPFTDNVRLHS